MRQDTAAEKASAQYLTAYGAHYKDDDLGAAFRLYRKVMAEHPDSAEFAYSLRQLENIVVAVIPTQELLDAHVRMALAHFKIEEAT